MSIAHLPRPWHETDGVSIYHPLSTNGERYPRNVLAYLPPGPVISSTYARHDGNLDAALFSASSSTTTIVSIKYRLGRHPGTSESDFRFPTPIHDVAIAFDYLSSSASPFNRDRSGKPRICLCGANIGGALCTMLALTKPNDVHALAVIEPLVDWVSLDEVATHQTPSTTAAGVRRKRVSCSNSKDYSHAVAAAAEELIQIRSTLFPSPSAYFDPFASPTLFLRAPGRDTPVANSVSAATTRDKDIGPDDNHDNHDPWRDSASATEPAESQVSMLGLPAATQPLPRRRKVLRRWPPAGRPENVLFPHTKVFVNARPAAADDVHANGCAGLLRAQGNELVTLMRRACFFGRDAALASERVGLASLRMDSRPNVVVEERLLLPRAVADSASASIWSRSQYVDVVDWLRQMSEGEVDS